MESLKSYRTSHAKPNLCLMLIPSTHPHPIPNPYPELDHQDTIRAMTTWSPHHPATVPTPIDFTPHTNSTGPRTRPTTSEPSFLAYDMNYNG